MHPHQQHAESLKCARICVERAHVMLNLVANFAELTLAEKAQLLSMLCERGGQELSLNQASLLLGQCPCADLGFCAEQDSAWVLAAGDLSVFEWLPDTCKPYWRCPAEPDPVELLKLLRRCRRKRLVQRPLQ